MPNQSVLGLCSKTWQVAAVASHIYEGVKASVQQL